jgi:hypothetical protein
LFWGFFFTLGPTWLFLPPCTRVQSIPPLTLLFV